VWIAAAMEFDYLVGLYLKLTGQDLSNLWINP